MRHRARLWVGLFLAWLALDRAATWTGSLSGEFGIPIALLVVALLIGIERLFFGLPPRRAALALGLGRPRLAGLAASVVIALILLAYFPLFARISGSPLGLREDWLCFLPGLFAQAGLAEEAIFRGYLFRHLARTRPYWRACLASLPPFLAVHLLLFATLPAAVAAAATVLSVVLVFPFSRLFVLGGGTLWAPAILHFTIQAAPKLVIAPAPLQTRMTLGWMAASLVVPWLAFALRPPPDPAAAA